MKNRSKTIDGVESERDDYLELVRRFPLRKIRNATELAETLAVMLPLAARATETPPGLTLGESDYLEALAILVNAYEKPAREKMTLRVTPLLRLQHYMVEHGMKAKSLGDLLGGKSAASMILNGKRRISREQAKLLAKRFAVDAGVFL